MILRIAFKQHVGSQLLGSNSSIEYSAEEVVDTVDEARSLGARLAEYAMEASTAFAEQAEGHNP